MFSDSGLKLLFCFVCKSPLLAAHHNLNSNCYIKQSFLHKSQGTQWIDNNINIKKNFERTLKRKYKFRYLHFCKNVKNYIKEPKKELFGICPHIVKMISRSCQNNLNSDNVSWLEKSYKSFIINWKFGDFVCWFFDI